MTPDAVLELLLSLCKQQMQQPQVDLAKLSVALGAVETPLTLKTQQQQPADLQVSCCQTLSHASCEASQQRCSLLRHLCSVGALQAEIDENLDIFQQFVAELHGQITIKQLTEPRVGC